MRWEFLQNGMVEMIERVDGHRDDDDEGPAEGNVQETAVDYSRFRIGI